MAIDIPDACKKFGCNEDIAREVEVNAPVRGHGFDYYCEDHGEAKRGSTYVREVRPVEDGIGPKVT